MIVKGSPSRSDDPLSMTRLARRLARGQVTFLARAMGTRWRGTGAGAEPGHGERIRGADAACRIHFVHDDGFLLAGPRRNAER